MQLENDLNDDFDEDDSSHDSIVNDTQIDVAVRQVVSPDQPNLDSTIQLEHVSQLGKDTSKVVAATTVSTPYRV
jgi:hypothetical protein